MNCEYVEVRKVFFNNIQEIVATWKAKNMKNSDLKMLNRVTEIEEAQLRTAAVIYAIKKINGMIAPFRKS